ncbi:MAG: TolC family protein, partial [bacterium]
SQLKATEQKILSDVTSSYYGVLFMNSTLAVSEEALQSSEENLNQVTQYFNVGKSSRFDVLRAEVQVANMKPMVISTINNLKLAESHLRMVIGINDSIDFNYTEKLELVYSELTEKSLNVLIDLALTSRPEIVMMDNQKYIAQKQVSMSRAAFIPSVMFGTAYQYQGQRDDFKFTGDDFFKSFNSSVSISIPIFNGMKSSAKYQQAKIAVKETEHQTESLVNGIKLEVKAAYFSIQEAMEKVQTQQKTIEQAKEAQRLARLLYSEGSSTQLDVINADLAVQQAQMNYQQSLFEYNVALANLKKAINQL